MNIAVGNYLVQIDREDYLKIAQWSLSIKLSDGGAYKAVIFSSGPHRHKSLARYLLGILEDSTVKADHIDRNTLNNTRANLRPVNDSESMLNRKNWGKSRYVGVYKNGRFWAASIWHEGKKVYLGTHPTQEIAWQARVAAEKKYRSYQQPLK
jgi:hypothetical protein